MALSGLPQLNAKVQQYIDIGFEVDEAQVSSRANRVASCSLGAIMIKYLVKNRTSLHWTTTATVRTTTTRGSN